MESEKRERFLHYAKQVKDLGYKVLIPNRESYSGTYGYIINDKDEVGYFQLGEFGYGVSFSTRHKPCCFGTGFCVKNWDEEPTEITKEVVDMVFIHHPFWVSTFEAKHLSEIKKYTEKSLRESMWGKDLIEL